MAAHNDRNLYWFQQADSQDNHWILFLYVSDSTGKEGMKDSLVSWCHLLSRSTGMVPLHQEGGQLHAYPWNTELSGLHRDSAGHTASSRDVHKSVGSREKALE